MHSPPVAAASRRCCCRRVGPTPAPAANAARYCLALLLRARLLLGVLLLGLGLLPLLQGRLLLLPVRGRARGLGPLGCRLC